MQFCTKLVLGKCLLKTMTLSALIHAIAVTASADIPSPPRKKPATKQATKIVPVIVESDAEGQFARDQVARIVIPRKLLPELTRRKSDLPPIVSPIGGTIIAGLALSAAAVSLMFWNQKRRRLQTAVVPSIGFLLLGTCGALLADVVVPGENPRVIDDGKPPGDKKSEIEIVIDEQGDEVVLTLRKQN